MADSKDLVLSFYKEVFENRNIDAIADFVAADAIDHTPMPGQPKGIEGVRYQVKLFLNAFSDISITVEETVAEGDRTAVVNTFHGTHTGELMNIAPTGKRVSIPNVDVAVARNGKMVEHWGFFDTVQLLVDLGALPAMA